MSAHAMTHDMTNETQALIRLRIREVLKSSKSIHSHVKGEES